MFRRVVVQREARMDLELRREKSSRYKSVGEGRKSGTSLVRIEVVQVGQSASATAMVCSCCGMVE